MEVKEAKKLVIGDRVIYMHSGIKTWATVKKTEYKNFVGLGDITTKKVKMLHITLDDGEGERSACWLQVLMDAADNLPGEPFDQTNLSR